MHIRVLKKAFTLVELLIVIGIIGLLLQLLLPAVEMSREAARRTQCVSQLKQLSLGALLHLNTHGFLPTGGWSGDFTADPSRGFGKEQPGGWAYSILPFVGLAELHNSGLGESMTSDALGPGLRRLHVSAPTLFYCPSRRLPRPYPLVRGEVGKWSLVVARGAAKLEKVTKCDYAANSGDSIHHAANSFGADMWWPSSYEALDQEPRLWTDTNDPDSEFFQTGVIYYRSEVKPVRILDGMSSTYLIGEKCMDSGTYKDINMTGDNALFGDNESAWAGYEWDNQRVAWSPNALSVSEHYQPQRDHPGANGPAVWAFGSAHPTSVNMSFCDGSVRAISYDIDRDVHRFLASRLDGTTTTASQE